MATPLTRQRPPIQAGSIRRSFTQPPRSLSFHERAGLDPSDSAANVLYSHPRARIVSFTPPTDAVRSVSSPSSVDLDYPIDTIGTLPWASRTEELLASGSLTIEKIRGSTNFLKSGTKPLHALMRNSQCWCVDGEATLVLRVGAFKYYRIELPYDTEEEKAQVQQLKDVLQRILRFEATPCPFKRGFHVDLPESATTPRKKGPWKRKPGSLSSPNSPSPSPLSIKKSRAPTFTQGSEEQYEVQTSPLGLKAVIKDTVDEPDDFEAEDEDIEQSTTVEDDSGVRVEFDPQNGRHTPIVPPNFISIAEPTHNRPLEAEGNGTDEQEPIGDQMMSDLLATEEQSAEVSVGEVEHQSEDNIELDQACKGVDAIDALPTSSVEIGKEDHHSDLSGNDLNLAEEKSEDSIDQSSRTVNPVLVHEHLLLEENVVPDLSEKIEVEEAVQEVADSTGPVKQLGQGSQEHRTIDKDETVEADESAEVAERDIALKVQPADPDESGHCRPSSPAILVDVNNTEKDAQERSPRESVHDSVSQMISPQAGSPLSDTISVSSTVDSFHSLASAEHRSPLSEADSVDFSDPTPLAESCDPLYLPRQQHGRDVAEMTMLAGSASDMEPDMALSPLRPSTALSEDPSTPSLLRSSASDSSWPEVETPTAVVNDNHFRRRMKAQRSFSPPPPSSTLFNPAPRSPRGTHLTGAILQKACNLALGKPIEVVVMLVHILARIAGGATVDDLMNGDLFRRPEELGPGHRRNHSLPEDADFGKGEASEEDDYGVPIRGSGRSAAPMVRQDDDADSLFDLD